MTVIKLSGHKCFKPKAKHTHLPKSKKSVLSGGKKRTKMQLTNITIAKDQGVV